MVEVEDARGYETTIELVEGLQFNRGYLSPYFHTNEANMKCEMNDAIIFLCDKKIDNIKKFVPVLNEAAKTGKPLLIICDGLAEDVLRTLVINKLQGGFMVCAIQCPAYGGNKKLVMEDLATLTNGKFVSEEKSMKMENVVNTWFGSAKKITVTKNKTTITNGGGSKILIDERCAQIKSEIESADTSDFEKLKLKERLAKLSNGIAIIKVGGATETEIMEKRDRIDDAKHATLAAIEEGFVAGGGTTYIHCAEAININVPNKDIMKGVEIIATALLYPFAQILCNAGYSERAIGKMMKDVLASGYGFGYNVKNGGKADMLSCGIIDPVKVLRVALENAASVAGVFLTTECVISNID